MALEIGAMLASLRHRPLAYQLNLGAGVLCILVALLAFIGAARTLELSSVALGTGQPTAEQQRAEAASLRAEVGKLAADLKSIQTDLRDVAALPKDAKLGLAQQQTQKAIKDLTERQDRLEEIIVTNPGKALELALLARDMENIKAAQQASLTAVKEAVDRTSSLTKWALAAMALGIVMLVIGNLMRGNAPY